MISISRPQITDTVKEHADVLEDPDHWNYALYLETTELGQTINALFPGQGQQFLNFKVALLRNTLCEQSLFIEGSKADIQQVLGLLQITGRKKNLHELLLREPEKEFQYAQKICGINQLFFVATGQETGGKAAAEKPLLKALDKTGILYIDNIHFLASETQKILAHYLLTGTFTPYKGEHQTMSEVRIVCSTTHEAEQRGLIIPELLSAIKRNTIAIPRPQELDDATFAELIKGFAWQLVPPEKILLWSSGVIDNSVKLINKKQVESICDLKKRVEGLLFAKSLDTKNTATDAVLLEPETGDSLITEAVSLGKETLRNEELVTKLWERLQSQAKIAKLIGINRSTVCRRLQELKLVDKEDEPQSKSKKPASQAKSKTIRSSL